MSALGRVQTEQILSDPMFANRVAIETLRIKLATAVRGMNAADKRVDRAMAHLRRKVDQVDLVVELLVMAARRRAEIENGEWVAA